VSSYEGPFGVGYGVAILHQPAAEQAPAFTCGTDASTTDDSEEGKALPQIARRSLEAAFRGDAQVPDFMAEGLLAERFGVYVTIRGPGRELRGCIGDLTPQFVNIAEETWHVARDAAFRDGRFAAVGAHELEHLRFEVSVVLPPEEITSTAELDARRFGVVAATEDGRYGVLLPDLEGIETAEQQVAIARRKGGIGEFEPVRIQRFTVKKFREED